MYSAVIESLLTVLRQLIRLQRIDRRRGEKRVFLKGNTPPVNVFSILFQILILLKSIRNSVRKKKTKYLKIHFYSRIINVSVRLVDATTLKRSIKKKNKQI